MEFKVPQNIDMPDRILGPLTMVQFIYAVVGFGVCYAIFMSVPAPFSYILIFPIALFVFFLDFVKVNERPFLDFFISALEYSMSPKKRLWLQDSDGDLNVEITKPVINKSKKIHKEVSEAEIRRVAQQKDGNTINLISN